MNDRKVGTYSYDHFMASKEVGEALLAMSVKNFELTMLITSGAPLEEIKAKAAELIALPSDAYNIAGKFFLLMNELAYKKVIE